MTKKKCLIKILTWAVPYAGRIKWQGKNYPAMQSKWNTPLHILQAKP
jgi:hypothetical protein